MPSTKPLMNADLSPFIATRNNNYGGTYALVPTVAITDSGDLLLALNYTISASAAGSNGYIEVLKFKEHETAWVLDSSVVKLSGKAGSIHVTIKEGKVYFSITVCTSYSSYTPTSGYNMTRHRSSHYAVILDCSDCSQLTDLTFQNDVWDNSRGGSSSALYVPSMDALVYPTQNRLNAKSLTTGEVKTLITYQNTDYFVNQGPDGNVLAISVRPATSSSIQLSAFSETLDLISSYSVSSGTLTTAPDSFHLRTSSTQSNTLSRVVKFIPANGVFGVTATTSPSRLGVNSKLSRSAIREIPKDTLYFDKKLVGSNSEFYRVGFDGTKAVEYFMYSVSGDMVYKYLEFCTDVSNQLHMVSVLESGETYVSPTGYILSDKPSLLRAYGWLAGG